MKNRAGSSWHSELSSRQGITFPYAIAYMSMTSILLTITGLSMASLLQADRKDDLESEFLRRVLRFEEQIRRDEMSTVSATVGESDIELILADESRIRWDFGVPVVREILGRSPAETAEPAASGSEGVIARSVFSFGHGAEITTSAVGSVLLVTAALIPEEPTAVTESRRSNVGQSGAVAVRDPVLITVCLPQPTGQEAKP